MKIAVLLATVLALSACGGSGSGGLEVVSADKTPVATPVEPPVVAGGSPSEPALLSLTSKNSVSSTSFNNYFKYEATAGERVVLRVNLTEPLSAIEFSRCASNPGAYPNQIHVYNATNVRVGGTCGEDFTFTFPGTGLFIFYFEFPSNGTGFVNAASLKGDTPVKFLEPGAGSPIEPKKVNLASANSIGSNVFGNYYWISAVAGETIVIDAILNQPLSVLQKTRCASGSEQLNSRILVYDDKLNPLGLACDESIRFRVPKSGNFIFQFNYGNQSSGVFSAAKI